MCGRTSLKLSIMGRYFSLTKTHFASLSFSINCISFSLSFTSTGTVVAADDIIPKNAIAHSGLFSERMATRSPFLTPKAIRADETVITLRPSFRYDISFENVSGFTVLRAGDAPYFLFMASRISIIVMFLRTVFTIESIILSSSLSSKAYR